MSGDEAATACPGCGAPSTYDGRVLVGGRGIYRCPRGCAPFQDRHEKPSEKGHPISHGPDPDRIHELLIAKALPANDDGTTTP